jgi:acyl-CoA oxidase
MVNTPTPSAIKNWISQGMVADWVVVFANLCMAGKQHGPHPFLFKIRDSATGCVVDGVSVEDMGPKTVANDLDNSSISFDHVLVPRTAMLNRFATIVKQADGKAMYTQLGANDRTHYQGRMRIEVIGQRLMTGRLAIAQGAIVAVRQLLIKTKLYGDNKLVHGICGQIPLSKLPHLDVIFKQAHAQLSILETFTASIEARLAVYLRSEEIPDQELTEAISVAKVKNIEAAIFWEHKLEVEVGSYALMAGSGFIYKDMLLCCKFAEGDSRVRCAFSIGSYTRGCHWFPCLKRAGV